MWTAVLMLTLAPGAVGANTGLKLDLTATKTKILVGEPLKVRLTWSSTGPLGVNPESVKLLVDDGTGFRQHVETAIQTVSVVGGPVGLIPGERRVTAHLLSVAGGGLPPSDKTAFRFAFPAVGRYRVMADYFGVTSNVGTIDVIAPDGKDAELFSRYLRPRPELLTEWALLNLRSDTDAELVGKLLDQYKGSSYLARPQVIFWEHEIGEALSSHYRLHGRDRSPLQGDAGQLLQRIESEALEGSPFDEDRLALVAMKKIECGDRLDGTRIYKEILTKYPQGHAAEEARAWVAHEEQRLPPEKP